MADDNDINSQDQLGETKLYKAARCGDRGECKKLLEAAADVNIMNNKGWSALIQGVSKLLIVL